jgi:hypothetical protein
MLAEPIVVPDGDSFLQVPIVIHAQGLPRLPALTYTQMARLLAAVERILIDLPNLPERSVRIEDQRLPALPALPAMDSAQWGQLQMHLERILKDPSR